MNFLGFITLVFWSRNYWSPGPGKNFFYFFTKKRQDLKRTARVKLELLHFRTIFSQKRSENFMKHNTMLTLILNSNLKLTLPFISSGKFVPPTIAHWHLVKRFAGTRVGCKCKMCLKKTAIYSQKKLATWKQSSCQGAYI